jgi:hypothetical protein
VLRSDAKSVGSALIDVNFMPNFARSEALSASMLAKTATFPELPSLTLISSLPWAITVHASGNCVIVGDIVQAICRALAIRITEDQIEEWMEQRGDECAKTGNGLGGRGLKRKRVYSEMTRLDLLEGRTRFAGLSESTMGCDIWVLNFV